MPNPFEDADSTEAANDRMLEQSQGSVAKAPQAQQFVELPGDETIDVEIADVEEEGVSRDEKKRNRFQEQYDGRESAERKVKELQYEIDRLRLQQSQAPAPQLASQAPTGDPYKEKLDELMGRRTDLHSAYQARMQNTQSPPSKEEEEGFLKKARDLEVEQQETIAEKVASKYRQPQQSAQDLAIQARHADVISSPRARSYADGEYRKLMALGESPSMELMDKVMDQARGAFGIGSRKNGSPPDPQQQVRYHAGGAARAGEIPDENPKKIRMTKELRRMADHSYAHIKDEQERYKKWANEIGPGYLEREKEVGR